MPPRKAIAKTGRPPRNASAKTGLPPPKSIVRTVPAELLLKVFYAFVEPRQGAGHYTTTDADLRHRRSVTISHVCRVWRALVLGEKALWTDIRLAGVARLDIMCLQRSHPLPLHLAINLAEMERTRKRRTKGGNAAQAVWGSVVSQGKYVLRRIHSIRAIHLGDTDVRNMVAAIQGTNLPALSQLFIQTTDPTPPNNWQGSPVWKPQQMLRSTLTTLELHSRHQTLDGKVLKRALELCKGLETLVLGGLLLEEFTSVAASSRPPLPGIHAPALKRLAVGAPIFARSEDHASCSTSCPCPFRHLVADNLEYLELAGGSIAETLDHFLPMVRKRTQATNANSPRRSPIALVLNSERASSRAVYEDIALLPTNVRLHLVNDASRAILDKGKVVGWDVCDWFKTARSTTLYMPKNSIGNGGAVRQGRYGHGQYRYVQRRDGSTAIVVHPEAGGSRGLDDTALEAEGWVLPCSEAYGPFLDADQPITEASDTWSEDDDIYDPMAGFHDDGGDWWQSFRRDMGWPDGYETPSD